MKYSISSKSAFKALLTVIGVNILLVIFLFSLGYFLDILPAFTLFGYKIIVFPLSLFVFILSLVSEIKVKNKRLVDIEGESSEKKSRMDKYHHT
ncbi:hypothetical protein [Gottfriedia solisilvae]|uniref:Uncharacterized protein n=1 Tax=Gottfriedia solisilvae TaxID=1516104 RepID=A0A8J3AFC4_9BACI|nr:hypothetical protein [Gottfriedia solisilvae]GGI13347.1 hypothetical protein GCM10007380_17460 [Gottfriedia solisilvae]